MKEFDREKSWEKLVIAIPNYFIDMYIKSVTYLNDFFSMMCVINYGVVGFKALIMNILNIKHLKL